MDHKCAPFSILCTIQKPVDTKLNTIRRSCTYTGKKRGVWRKHLDNRSDNYQFTEFERVAPTIRKEGTIKGNSITAGNAIYCICIYRRKQRITSRLIGFAKRSPRAKSHWSGALIHWHAPSFLGGQLTDLNVKAASEAMTLFGSSRSIPNDLRKTGGKTSQTGLEEGEVKLEHAKDQWLTLAFSSWLRACLSFSRRKLSFSSSSERSELGCE